MSFAEQSGGPAISRDRKRMSYAPFIDTASGCMGGLACVLAGQPFDTVKTRLQALPALYKNVPTCIRATFRQGGLRSFYFGSFPAFITNVTENAVLFLFYGQCQRFIQYLSSTNSENELALYQRGLAGSLSSVFTSVLISPLEMLKCRLQIQKQKNSLWQITSHIYKEDGIRGYFRGLTSTWAREIPGYFSFFLTYEFTKRALTRPDQAPEAIESYKVIVAGGLAGCGFWLVSYPMDSVKSRIQVKVAKSSSLICVALQMFKSEGMLSFYKGISPALIRSFPANASLFLAYESSKKYLDQLVSSFKWS